MKIRYLVLLLMIGITAVVLRRPLGTVVEPIANTPINVTVARNEVVEPTVDTPINVTVARNEVVEPIVNTLANVTVAWNENVTLTKHHPRIQIFWGEAYGEQTVTVVDDVVTVDASYSCGDECGTSIRLVLVDNGTGQLPDFVSFDHFQSDVFDESDTYLLRNGRLIIQEWDTSGVVSGYIKNDDNHRSQFYFWHNFAGDDLLSQYIDDPEIVSDEVLITALQTGDLAAKRDALFIIRQERPDALIVPLIDALADVTPIPHDGSLDVQWRFISNEVAFTLSAVAQNYGGVYFAFREPIIDYMAQDRETLEANPQPPSPERIAEIQDNWRAEFNLTSP